MHTNIYAHTEDRKSSVDAGAAPRLSSSAIPSFRAASTPSRPDSARQAICSLTLELWAQPHHSARSGFRPEAEAHRFVLFVFRFGEEKMRIEVGQHRLHPCSFMDKLPTAHMLVLVAHFANQGQSKKRRRVDVAYPIEFSAYTQPQGRTHHIC